MNSIVKPARGVSFEDALRNLASRLTGTPVAKLPRTQESIVQYMAEHAPTLNDMVETITQEVLARLTAAAPVGEPGQPVAPTKEDEPEKPDGGQQEDHGAPEVAGGTPTPEEDEKANTAAPVAPAKPKRGSKTKK